PALRREVAPQQRHHVGIVVHDEDPGSHGCSFPLSDLAAGSQTVNIVPWPTSLVTRRSLPFDRIRSRQIESPRPVPALAGLVLKKGSKIRGRISAGIPSPVSSTVIVTPRCPFSESAV